MGVSARIFAKKRIMFLLSNFPHCPPCFIGYYAHASVIVLFKMLDMVFVQKENTGDGPKLLWLEAPLLFIHKQFRIAPAQLACSQVQVFCMSIKATVAAGGAAAARSRSSSVAAGLYEATAPLCGVHVCAFVSFFCIFSAYCYPSQSPMPHHCPLCVVRGHLCLPA